MFMGIFTFPALLAMKSTLWLSALTQLSAIVATTTILGLILKSRGYSIFKRKGLHKEQVRQMGRLYDHSPKIWIATGAEGELIYANAPARKWLNIDLERILKEPSPLLRNLDEPLSQVADGHFHLHYTNGPHDGSSIEGDQTKLEFSDSSFTQIIQARDISEHRQHALSLKAVVAATSLSGKQLYSQTVQELAGAIERAQVLLTIPVEDRPRWQITEASSHPVNGHDNSQTFHLGSQPWDALQTHKFIAFPKQIPAEWSGNFPRGQSLLFRAILGSDERILGVLICVSEREIKDVFRVQSLLDLAAERLSNDLVEHERYTALQQTHAFYQQMLDAMPSMVWRSEADPSRRIAFNETWHAFRRSTRDEESGQRWLEGVPKSHRSELLERLNRRREEPASFSQTYPLIRHDGDIRWIQEEARPQWGTRGSLEAWVGTCTDITHRHHLEQEQRLFKQAVESSTAGIIIAALESTGVIIHHINHAFAQLTGYSASDVIGKRVVSVLGHGSSRESIHALKAAIGEKNQRIDSFRACHKDGHFIRLSLSVTQVPSVDSNTRHCVLTIHEEILNEMNEASTERAHINRQLKLAENELQDRSHQLDLEIRHRFRLERRLQLLRIVLDQIPEPTLVAIPSGQCQILNEAAIDDLEIRPGQDMEDWLKSKDASLSWTSIHAQIEDLITDRISLEIRQNGETNRFHLIGKTIHLGEETYISITWLNVSEHQHSDQKLLQQKEELEKASQSKSQFVAAMSHELRTPLNSILMLAEAVQDGIYGPISTLQAKSIKSLEDSGKHLLALINDVLDLSKIEAGKVELKKAPVSVKELCDASLDLLKQQAERKNIDLRCSIDGSSETLACDRRRFSQVLVNLLSNAVKFTPSGGIVSLEVTEDEEADILTFAVADTGPGIPKAQMNRLFEPFVQLDSGNSRKQDGSGLGLSLARELTQIHGGFIDVFSEEGVGSRFSVTLPRGDVGRTPLATREPEAQANLNDSPTTISLESRAILVVDDHLKNQQLVRDFLVSRNYEVLTASDGKSAVERALFAQPDLVLMDIQMPGMDGFEAIRLIRRDPTGRYIPIIAMTAMAMEGDRETCIDAGANDYISKPIRLNELATMIKHHIRSHTTL